MATTLHILGWTAMGLRCPDHTISFENQSGWVHKISLIQMPNGTGKTTTLKLLRAALAGPGIWNSSFGRPLHYRKSTETESGSFVLRLLHAERALTIKMEFDFTQDSDLPGYKTTSTHGTDEGFRLPDELIPFLAPDFVRLLIFDGELANHLLDSTHTNAQQAIEVLYRLPLLQQMHDRVEDYWSASASEAGSSGGKKEFTQRQNRVNRLKEHLDQVEKQQSEELQKLEEVNGKLRDLEREFSDEIKKNDEDRKKLEQADRALETSKRHLSDVTRKMAEAIKNPAELSPSFDAAIIDLKGSFDRVKLPGIAAREFFEEIADELQCICGRKIDADISATIRKGADQYLGSEEVATLNAMKSDIKERITDTGTISSNELAQCAADVEKAQDAVSQARQKSDAIKQIASGKDPAIEKIHTKIKELEGEKGRLNGSIQKYSDISDQSDASWNPDILKRNIKLAEDALAETTGTLNQKKKKDILQGILSEALKQARQQISERVCQSTNERIEALMPYNNIRVEKIDRSIRLVDKESGSAGETLTVGYAYLSSLLSNADHSLPSVVDSPSGPIDSEIRPEIGRLIPKLGEQFICFIISSEREDFVHPLMEASEEPPYFLTLFRKGNSKWEELAKTASNVKETEDGICIAGQDFFNNFHSGEKKA